MKKPTRKGWSRALCVALGLSASCLPLQAAGKTTVVQTYENPVDNTIHIFTSELVDHNKKPVEIGSDLSVDDQELLDTIAQGEATAVKGGVLRTEEDGALGIVQIQFQVAGKEKTLENPVNVLLVLDQSASMVMYFKNGFSIWNESCLNPEHSYFVPAGTFGNHGAGYLNICQFNSEGPTWDSWYGDDEHGHYVAKWVVDMLNTLGPKTASEDESESAAESGEEKNADSRKDTETGADSGTDSGQDPQSQPSLDPGEDPLQSEKEDSDQQDESGTEQKSQTTFQSEREQQATQSTDDQNTESENDVTEEDAVPSQEAGLPCDEENLTAVNASEAQQVQAQPAMPQTEQNTIEESYAAARMIPQDLPVVQTALEAAASKPQMETVIEYQTVEETVLVEQEPVEVEETIQELVEQEPVFDEDLQEWITPEPVMEEKTVTHLVTPDPVETVVEKQEPVEVQVPVETSAQPSSFTPPVDDVPSALQEIPPVQTEDLPPVEMAAKPEAVQHTAENGSVETEAVREDQTESSEDGKNVLRESDIPVAPGQEKADESEEADEEPADDESDKEKESESAEETVQEDLSAYNTSEKIYDSAYNVNINTLRAWNPATMHYVDHADGSHEHVEVPPFPDQSIDGTLIPWLLHYSAPEDNPYHCYDRMLLSKQYARNFVSSLMEKAPGTKVAVELFGNNENAKFIHDFTDQADELTSILSFTEGTNRTNYEGAFQRAQDLVKSSENMNKNAPLYTIFVSDGRPDESLTTDPAAAGNYPLKPSDFPNDNFYYGYAAAEEFKKNVRQTLYTVGLQCSVGNYLSLLSSSPDDSLDCRSMEQFEQFLDHLESYILSRYPRDGILSDVIADGFSLLIDREHPFRIDEQTYDSLEKLPETVAVNGQTVQVSLGELTEKVRTISFFVQAFEEVMENMDEIVYEPTNKSASLSYSPVVEKDQSLEYGPTEVVDLQTPYMVFKNSLISASKSSNRMEETLQPGDEIEYILTAQNDGLVDVEHLYLDDLIPEGTEYVSGGTYRDGRVYFTIDDLKAGSSREVRFKVRVLEGVDSITNTGNFGVTKDPDGNTPLETNPVENPVVIPEEPEPEPENPAEPKEPQEQVIQEVKNEEAVHEKVHTSADSGWLALFLAALAAFAIFLWTLLLPHRKNRHTS